MRYGHEILAAPLQENSSISHAEKDTYEKISILEEVFLELSLISSEHHLFL